MESCTLMSYYKVVATVHEVNKPRSMTPGKPSHVVLPCRMYKVGDKIVIEDNQINVAETTGALCLSLISSMIPVLKAMQRAVKPISQDGIEKHDSTQGVTWFSCPDAERPVIFKIQRVPDLISMAMIFLPDSIIKSTSCRPCTFQYVRVEPDR